jgi:hypothetical protein
MTHGKRTVQILGSIALIAAAVPFAQAGTITLVTTPFSGTSNLDLSSLGTGYCIGNAGGGLVCSPGNDPIAVGTENLTFSNSNAQNDEVFIQGTGGGNTFQGNFSPNTYLLATVANADTLTISFAATELSSVGFYIQEADFNSSTFTATINLNGGTACAGITGGCSETTTSAGGDPIFIGLQNTSNSATIASINITTSSTSNPSTASGNFYIADLTFDVGGTSTPPPTVPEPSTIAMMIGGLGVVAWKARKRVKA